MNVIRFWNRLKGRPVNHERDIEEELAFHEQMKERELRANGMPEGEARLESRRSIGNLAHVREEAFDAWTFRWLYDVMRDLRYGARSLASNKGFTIAAVLALVLGIGVNAILFNVYNTLAFAPWAIRDAREVVQAFALIERNRWNGFSWPEYRYLRDHTQTLSGVVASTNTGIRVQRGEVAWSGIAVAASENFFDVIGTGFAAGRGFSPESVPSKPAPEVVLHYDTWMSRFGGDRAVIGEWIELNGQQLQVVGVAVEGFSGPSPGIPQLWVPAGWRDMLHPGTRSIDNPDNCCTSVLGRLRPGVDRAAAQAELSTLNAQFAASVKRDATRIQLTAPTMMAMANSTMRGRASVVFMALGTASLLILMLACANVGNLQLARSVARRREIAIRLSIGAGRGRILRQLLVESMLLSAMAGAISLALASWGPKRIMQMIAPPEARMSFQFANDWRVIGFILLVTMAAAILFGLAPAWSAVRDAVANGLREGGRTTSGGRMRTILLAAQVALCAVLVSGAALLVRAFGEARHLEAGFRFEDIVLMAPGLESSGLNEDQARGTLQPLVERIGRLPGVISVAHASVVPLSNSFNSASVPDPVTKQPVRIGFNHVSANFFETIGVPFVAGRGFTAADEGRTDRVIMTQAAAERLWPSENPVGKTTALLDRPVEVIGVVRDFSTRELGPSKELHVYLPSRGTRTTSLLVRYTGPLEAILATLPRIAKEQDRRLMASVTPFGQNVDRARQMAAVSASIAGVLSGLSLLLACVGIYGVAAYNVSQRSREIGVRMALGARPRAIVEMVLRQNLRTVLAGAAVGIVAAVGFARLLTSLLYGVKPGDPGALLGAAAVLLLTAGLATWGPARRASSVDPAITLRHD
jgi:predicted permease